jgi:CheY-like chemotaxis protein
MSVYSQVGRGTTFKIYLPRVSESEAGARDSGREQPLPTGTETILLVEDDGTVRKVAARILSVLGYKVLEAENGTRAMDIAVQHEGRIDLLLTDIIMPGVDGRSVADLVGGVRPGIKVIFASGYPVAHLEEIGVLGRDMALLTKPFGRSELAKKVREVLDRA